MSKDLNAIEEWAKGELVKLDQEYKARCQPFTAILNHVDNLKATQPVLISIAEGQGKTARVPPIAINDHVAIIGGTFYGENAKIIDMRYEHGMFWYAGEILTGVNAGKRHCVWLTSNQIKPE